MRARTLGAFKTKRLYREQNSWIQFGRSLAVSGQFQRLEFQKRNFYILQGEDGAQGRAGIQGSQGSLVSCRRSQYSN